MNTFKLCCLFCLNCANHNTSPWFESIRDDFYKAKRKDVKQRENEANYDTKLTIFKDLYRQARHNVSKLVRTTKC